MNLAGKKIWIAGHSGMVGAALLRRLQNESCEILTAPHAQLDLCNQQAVDQWLSDHQPDAIFIAAAKVGGIYANNIYRAQFLYDNLMIAANIINASHRVGVEKLLFLGSSCIYPRDSTQPIKEEALLTGVLESTNEPYALAKIAGIKLCQAFRAQYECDFISAQPANLYGTGDNFQEENSHVMAALLYRFHQAKCDNMSEVAVWGSGAPRREFLFVDDLADACVFLMQHYSDSLPINIGIGEDITIAALAEKIAALVGFQGNIIFDISKPDGTARKMVDISKMNQLGWRAKTPLETGLQLYYEWFLANQEILRR